MSDHGTTETQTGERTGEKTGDPVAAMRRQLCDLLPRAVQNAIASYRDFSAQSAPDDAKQFIAHHNACRAALAHLEALSKLGRWLLAHGTAEPHDPRADALEPLLREAHRVLTQLQSPCESAEEESDEPGAAEL